VFSETKLRAAPHRTSHDSTGTALKLKVEGKQGYYHNGLIPYFTKYLTFFIQMTGCEAVILCIIAALRYKPEVRWFDSRWGGSLNYFY
jgi:hypothetical protein